MTCADPSEAQRWNCAENPVHSERRNATFGMERADKLRSAFLGISFNKKHKHGEQGKEEQSVNLEVLKRYFDN